jgi:hypothetical protein
MLLTAAECGVDCPGPAAQQVVGPARCARAALRARGHDSNDALSALLRLHHAISSNVLLGHLLLLTVCEIMCHSPSDLASCTCASMAECIARCVTAPVVCSTRTSSRTTVACCSLAMMLLLMVSLLITTVLCSGLFVNVLPALLGAGNFVGEPVSPLTQLLRSLTTLRVALARPHCAHFALRDRGWPRKNSPENRLRHPDFCCVLGTTLSLYYRTAKERVPPCVHRQRPPCSCSLRLDEPR